jgi:hypothetical protein
MKLQLLLPIAGMLAISCAPVQAQSNQNMKSHEKTAKVTVTGCLMKGTQPNEYTIAENGATYELFSTGKVDMAPHVGHKVQVKGTAEKAEAASPNTANRTSEERVDVTSVKHISKTCQ